MAKRIFDLTLTIPGLIFLSPLFVIVMLLIKRDSAGPVFFRQVRLGRHGRPFHIFKFRTMVVDADRVGAQITPDNDARITRVGHFLRKCKLDELPQLFNVLRGEMSLVGPRPEVPRYVALYSPDQRRVLEQIPGITDPASIRYSKEGEILSAALDPEAVYVQTIMPDKVRLNLEYAGNATVLSDFLIVLKTIGRLVRTRG